MTDYRVALDVYQGPMDLLLFLIKRDEIDIYDIPISHITEQYLQYVDLLQELDPEVIGDFLVLAATLMEIKSRSLLPRPPVVEDVEELADPRLELVRQLLEYKRFKDAAYSLGEAAEERAQQHARVPALPPEPEDSTDLENLEVWDLFEAFNRLLEQTGKRSAYHKVGVDDTPITLHAEDILDSLQRAGGDQQFEEIFVGRNRGEMIGLFLALLELIRQRRVRVRQDSPSATILVTLLDATPLTYNTFDAENDDLDHTMESETDDDASPVIQGGETELEGGESAAHSVDEHAAEQPHDLDRQTADGDAAAADTDATSTDDGQNTVYPAGNEAVVDSADAPVDEVLSDTGRVMSTSTDPLPSLAAMPPDDVRLATPARGMDPARELTPRRAVEATPSTEGSGDDHDEILVADTIGDELGHSIERLGFRDATDPDSNDDSVSDQVTPETTDPEPEHPHDTK